MLREYRYGMYLGVGEAGVLKFPIKSLAHVHVQVHVEK